MSAPAAKLDLHRFVDLQLPSAGMALNFGSAEELGSQEFRDDYHARYAYVAGAMYKGIASARLVVRMGRAGMLSFLGTGGLSFADIEAGIQLVQKELDRGQPYGMNLLHHPGNAAFEQATVDLFLKHGVRNIEAAAFMSMTPALVKYRLKGLRSDASGAVIAEHRVIAKISRPEVGEAFLSPAPEHIVRQLLAQGQITPAQADLSRRIAMCDDVCAEADSGGHTDGAVSITLIPTIARLRDTVCRRHGFAKLPRVGAAGGIGTPEAVAAVLLLGAQFVVTGSINQCTVEAGVSDQVKDMLQEMNIQDTEYAPAGDMFELGAKVQVLKRGVFFPARANKLYELWKQFDSWEAIDEKQRRQIEEKFFMRSFEAVYAETRDFYARYLPAEIDKAEQSPKHKLGLVFRWYFILGSRLAMAGDPSRKVDYQVHTGPAMGAFNQWVKGTALESWRNRHVDEIGLLLIHHASELLKQRLGVAG